MKWAKLVVFAKPDETGDKRMPETADQVLLVRRNLLRGKGVYRQHQPKLPQVRLNPLFLSANRIRRERVGCGRGLGHLFARQPDLYRRNQVLGVLRRLHVVFVIQ